MQKTQPWKPECKDKKKILYEVSDSIKAISILLWPIIPNTCERISKVFNFKINFSEIKKPLKVTKIKKAEILFKKIEIVKDKITEEKINKSTETKKDMIEGIGNIVQFADWQKMDLRVGEIENVEDITGADKLYKLTINIGHENRTICAGIKQFYSKDDLKGKQIVVIANLEPRVMKGIESKGMLLAAGSKDDATCVLISPDSNVKPGTRIS